MRLPWSNEGDNNRLKGIFHPVRYKLRNLDEKGIDSPENHGKRIFS